MSLTATQLHSYTATQLHSKDFPFIKKWMMMAILLFAIVNAKAQNTFPPSGNAGIGTSTPSGLLNIKSSDGLNTSNCVYTNKPAFKLDYYYSNYMNCPVGPNGGGGTTGTPADMFTIRSYNFGAYPVSNYNSIFEINSSGNIGMGIAPQLNTKLSIGGSLKLINGDIIIQGNNTNSAGNTEIKLTSNGYIRARDIQVDLLAIPDYVFQNEYSLMSLDKLESYIKENKHLPNIKSEKEFQDMGSYSLGEMNTKLLEKVEELTIYIIQQKKQIEQLNERVNNIIEIQNK